MITPFLKCAVFREILQILHFYLLAQVQKSSAFSKHSFLFSHPNQKKFSTCDFFKGLKVRHRQSLMHSGKISHCSKSPPDLTCHIDNLLQKAALVKFLHL